MRQIKFRGKSMYSGEWMYGSLIINNEQRLIYPIPDEPIQDFDGIDQDAIPETIGQFTGIYDRLDNPIYEGDIVSYYDIKDDRIDNTEPPIYYLERQENEVIFDKGCFLIDGNPIGYTGVFSKARLEDYFGILHKDALGKEIDDSLIGVMVISSIHEQPNEDF